MEDNFAHYPVQDSRVLPGFVVPFLEDLPVLSANDSGSFQPRIVMHTKHGDFTHYWGAYPDGTWREFCCGGASLAPLAGTVNAPGVPTGSYMVVRDSFAQLGGTVTRPSGGLIAGTLVLIVMWQADSTPATITDPDDVLDDLTVIYQLEGQENWLTVWSAHATGNTGNLTFHTSTIIGSCNIYAASGDDITDVVSSASGVAKSNGADRPASLDVDLLGADYEDVLTFAGWENVGTDPAQNLADNNLRLNQDAPGTDYGPNYVIGNLDDTFEAGLTTGLTDLLGNVNPAAVTWNFVPLWLSPGPPNNDTIPYSVAAVTIEHNRSGIPPFSYSFNLTWGQGADVQVGDIVVVALWNTDSPAVEPDSLTYPNLTFTQRVTYNFDDSFGAGNQQLSIYTATITNTFDPQNTDRGVIIFTGDNTDQVARLIVCNIRGVDEEPLQSTTTQGNTDTPGAAITITTPNLGLAFAASSNLSSYQSNSWQPVDVSAGNLTQGVTMQWSDGDAGVDPTWTMFGAEYWGAISLEFHRTISAQAQTGDDFAGAITADTSFSYAVDSAHMALYTQQDFEDFVTDGADFYSIWFRLEAPAAGNYTVDTTASTYSADISICRQTGADPILLELAFVQGGSQSETFTADGTSNYYVHVGGLSLGDYGDLALTIS